MRANVAGFASGALFAVGLVLSGMIKPSKVVGFLDVAGSWDPSLAFVMLGAVAVHFVGYRIVMRRTSPLFDVAFHVPRRTDIDAPLLVGAALFGVGWGLGGFCPGPGIVAGAGGSLTAVTFLAGMALGALLEQNVVSAARASYSRRRHSAHRG